MVRFVGLDVHKRSLVYCILAADGEILTEGKLEAVDAQSLAQFAQQLTPDDRLALEATTNCWAVARALRPPTLPLEAATAEASVAPTRREDGEEGALNHEPEKSHCG